MSYHTNHVPDARLVDTHWLGRTRAALNGAVRDPEEMRMILVHGEAGLGKSLAVEVAVAEHPDLEVHWLDFWRGATTPQVARTLALKIANTHERLWMDQLDSLLIDVLSQKRRILVIEEAQRLGYDAIEYLRRLHDQEQTQFAIVFVGGNGCWKTISKYPMVQSRIREPIQFLALDPEQVVQELPRFHPLLRRTPAALIREIDRVWAKGNFRRWALFVEHAIDICADHKLKTANSKVTANVMTKLGVNWQTASKQPTSSEDGTSEGGTTVSDGDDGDA